MLRLFVRHLSTRTSRTKEVVRDVIANLRKDWEAGKPLQYPPLKSMPSDFLKKDSLFSTILSQTQFELLRKSEPVTNERSLFARQFTYENANILVNHLVENEDKLEKYPITVIQGKDGRSTLHCTIERIVEQMAYHRLRPRYAQQVYEDSSNSQNYNKNMTLNSLNLDNPYAWYPEARKLKRKIIMHVGPTNSGKTYNALKRLETSSKGYYAGPLRLLAREVFEKFQDKGIRCNLMTGEEVLLDSDKYGNKAGLTSGTIEMIPMSEPFDVVVVDEIQMIGDPFRGSAWTNVILGAQAKEIHLCGEVSAVPLVEQLVAMTGDDIEINNYNRLGKLAVDSEAISLDEVQRGDCIVAFSKKQILTIKAQIERDTNLKCAVIYGALPPETRSQEARMFNDGQYDVVVASDAIGMGLNLKINRVVFTTLEKYDGRRMTALSNSSIKQIGGRAGRYGIGEGVGHITALTEADLNKIRVVMQAPIEYLDKAVLWPSDPQWMHYYSMFPKNTKLITMFRKFEADLDKSMRTNPKESIFRIQHMDDQMSMAKFINERHLEDEFAISDQLRFISCPSVLKLKDSPMHAILTDVFQNYMITVAQRLKRSVFDYKSMPLYLTTTSHLSLDPAKPKLHKNFTKSFGVEAVPERMKKKIEYAARRTKENPFVGKKTYVGDFNPIEDRLMRLEQFHRLLTAYLWLTYRFPQNFVHLELATKLVVLVETKISEMLMNVSFAKQMQERWRER
ncbi:hypothetical protein KL919_001883 [Ogataea angusta]|nr:hypothetical protein KL920_001258 [Ogataea angusta]KAG7861149.1 hypothetical protein KL919_001883 [Ogataea angusta]